jgi:Zinc-finger of RNA-polymerase I-specific TFIIB, Rrn7
MKNYPVCPVCESREYELRDGNYFCVLCSTQSQELGLEKVLEEDQLLSLGMRPGASISVAGQLQTYCRFADCRYRYFSKILRMIPKTFYTRSVWHHATLITLSYFIVFQVLDFVFL